MDGDQCNTMLIFANYLFGMNENQTSIRKGHTNNTPFVVIKDEKTKETIKEKKTFNPKTRVEEQMISFENKIQRSVDL
jgi:hypothetical protein